MAVAECSYNIDAFEKIARYFWPAIQFCGYAIIFSGKSNQGAKTLPSAAVHPTVIIGFMDHKQAANILVNLVKKRRISAEEKQAALTAIGVLSWTYLAGSKLQARKARREKSLRLKHP